MPLGNFSFFCDTSGDPHLIILHADLVAPHHHGGGDVLDFQPVGEFHILLLLQVKELVSSRSL